MTLTRTRSNDKKFERFLDFYVRNYNSLLQTSLGILENLHDAEDVLSDLYFKLPKISYKYRSRQGELMPWMKKIVRNESLSYLRNRIRRKRHEIGFTDLSTDGDLFEDEEAVQPIKPLADSELREKVKERVWYLTNKDSRDILRLHYYKGFGYKAIAKILGINIGTVKSRLHSARLKLKSRLVSNIGLESLI